MKGFIHVCKVKGSIHICKIKEKLDRILPLRLDEFDVGKLNAPMIR